MTFSIISGTSLSTLHALASVNSAKRHQMARERSTQILRRGGRKCCTCSPDAGVGADACIGNKSTQIYGEVSSGSSLLRSTSSYVYSASTRHISVENEGVTSMFLAMSRGTPACRHSFMIRTGKDRELCLQFSPMHIPCEVNVPTSIHLFDIMQPRQA